MNANKNNTMKIIPLAGEKKNRMSIHFSQNGIKPITFTIKKNHRIVIDPVEGWMDKVPSSARDQIFEMMLAHFRDASSVSGDNIKVSCIGVTNTGEAYIAANTENRGDNGFNRDCAEQNMINTFRQLEKDPNKKIASVYIMGGRDKGSPSIICPCGSCVDTLARETAGTEAPITVFPVKTLQDRKKTHFNISAADIGEVSPGEGWKTSIDQLNAFRDISLDPSDAQRQAQAIGEILDIVCNDGEAPSDQFHEVSKTNLQELISSQNCAKLSNYAQLKIALALKNRVKNDPEFLSLSEPSERKEFLKSKVQSVEIAVAKLENGECFESIVVHSDYDRASPGAVSLAVLQNQLSNAAVTDVSFIEFNPKKSKAKTSTPKKEDVERALKRSSEGVPLTFHIVPFVPLSQLEDPEIKVLAKHFSAHALFPSNFTGMKPTPKNNISNISAISLSPKVPQIGSFPKK
jgi:cytidine deaminase